MTRRTLAKVEPETLWLLAGGIAVPVIRQTAWLLYQQYPDGGQFTSAFKAPYHVRLYPSFWRTAVPMTLRRPVTEALAAQLADFQGQPLRGRPLNLGYVSTVAFAATEPTRHPLVGYDLNAIPDPLRMRYALVGAGSLPAAVRGRYVLVAERRSRLDKEPRPAVDCSS